MSASIPDHAALSVEELRRQLRAASAQNGRPEPRFPPMHQHMWKSGQCLICSALAPGYDALITY